MARTIIEYTYNNYEEFTQYATRVLSQNGYRPVVEKNENVYKCGVGFLTAMKYIKIEYSANNVARISAWVRAVAGREMNLDGIVGIIPKKQVKRVVEQITLAKK